MTNKKSP